MWQLIKCHRIWKTAGGPGVKTMCMRLMVLVLLVSATISAQTTPADDTRARLDKLRADGYEALYNLDYEGARKRFREMLKIAPDNPSGAQCFAASLWVEQLNQSWELKATLYSTKAYTEGKRKADPAQTAEFRKWIRQTKTLAQAKLRQNPRDARGWIMMMRSRMALNEPQLAAEALRTGLAAFRNDAATQARLREAARALAIPGA